MKGTPLALAALAIAVASGCTVVDPSHSFGRASRTLVTAQTVNPAAGEAVAPASGDPEVTKAAVDNLRHDSAPKETTARPGPR